jgi:hypothetical protein
MAVERVYQLFLEPFRPDGRFAATVRDFLVEDVRLDAAAARRVLLAPFAPPFAEREAGLLLRAEERADFAEDRAFEAAGRLVERALVVFLAVVFRADFAADLRAVVFFAADFRALVLVDFAADFRVVFTADFAVDFRAAVFLAAGFRAAVFFAVVVFFAAVFRAAVFFVAAFLVVAFLVVVFLAVVFLAADLRAVDFEDFAAVRDDVRFAEPVAFLATVPVPDFRLEELFLALLLFFGADGAEVVSAPALLMLISLGYVLSSVGISRLLQGPHVQPSRLHKATTLYQASSVSRKLREVERA